MASSRPRAQPRSPLVALFGPTAAGKTAVAAVLRQRLGAEVISADSAALYRDIPIITAAPDYPARLVGTVPLSQDVSVGAYQRWAHEAIDEAARPLLVGGTGLYFRAAVTALRLPPAAEPARRAHWQDEYDRLGGVAAHEQLARVDPAAAARLHPNDRKRIVRALELAETGASLAPEHNRLWSEELRSETLIVALDLPLDVLDERIQARSHAMAAAGAADEARRAWAGRLSATARKVIGLEQFATLAERRAVEEVTLATRRLARYQRKWLRRMPGVVTLPANRPAEEVADEIVALAGAGQRLPRH